MKKLLELLTDPSFLWKNNVYLLVLVGDYENQTKNWIQTYPYTKIFMIFLNEPELPYFQIGGGYLSPFLVPPVAPPLFSTRVLMRVSKQLCYCNYM